MWNIFVNGYTEISISMLKSAVTLAVDTFHILAVVDTILATQ